MNPPPRANFFDASALAKVFAREPDSAPVRLYWDTSSPTKYTSPFCLYEALTTLKVLWMYRKTITEEKYHQAAERLIVWFSASSRYNKDLDLHDAAVLRAARDMAQRYSLDLSDAFQILCVKEGRYSRLVDRSQTVLVTADEALAKAARSEGLKAWYCIGEPAP
ncbi:MAG: type II toxin-antitoxin system VapC family toxin [Rhodocyclaceae bacterium]|jgi:predicted nucleic acid-binding protein|nr:type II toxin-antitoxin system VapC family toxin [Rhodocyclaceae bacterium]MCO5099126.1 type II toxin-antitoxin system VapC family toxin [Rhodocyclaceae bacterium]